MHGCYLSHGCADIVDGLHHIFVAYMAPQHILRI